MISQDLEVSLHMAFVDARQKRHELITVEHLVLALLDNPSARKALEGCGVNAKALRAELVDHISRSTPSVREGREVDTQPTLGFQRVLQRAILHVQSSGKKEVTGADVLVAIFGESDAHAVLLLKRHGVRRLDVVNYVSHGVTKQQAAHDDDSEVSASADPGATGPILAHDLQAKLNEAIEDARGRRHEFMTVEHLLLALVACQPSAEVLRACGANMESLRDELLGHIVQQTPLIAESSEASPERTLGFERVIQRATLHVRSLGKNEVTAIDILLAVFGEKDSHAVFFLQKQGITRLEVVSSLAKAEAVSEAPVGDALDVQVVLYRDDHTPTEFLVRVLLEIFAMDRLEAAEMLLEIYRDGQAVCGLYSREAGETTVKQVLAFAHGHGQAVRCSAVVPKQA